jgi:hypothetical protein
MLSDLLSMPFPIASVVIDGSTFYVRMMSCAEVDALYAAAEGTKGHVLMARTVATTLCDSAGKRTVADGDWEQLLTVPHERLMAIFDAAAKLNGMTKEAAENAAKN